MHLKNFKIDVSGCPQAMQLLMTVAEDMELRSPVLGGYGVLARLFPPDLLDCWKECYVSGLFSFKKSSICTPRLWLVAQE
jgi:hypothetical protein